MNALFSVFLATAMAHEFRPAVLDLTEDGRGVSARWIAPVEGLQPQISGCGDIPGTGAFRLDCPEGLAGAHISVTGPDDVDVVVRAILSDGRIRTGVVAADRPLEITPTSSVSGYLRLGASHVLGGLDHLLFVAGLVLVVRRPPQLVATVTAFTVAHSLTLAAAVLGVLTLPSAPVEAVIALSIVWVAVEACRETPTHTAPMAFGFGLLHGLGFAGALGDIGLAPAQTWPALLSFNIGVELGQLAFVLAILGPVTLLRRGPASWYRVPAYAIGSLGAAWTLERVAAFW